ncbi:AAA family ATPase, partial [Vibrio sinensis]
AEEQPAVDDIDDSFNFDDFELPEFGEEEALAELDETLAEPELAQESNLGQENNLGEESELEQESNLDQELNLEPESLEQESASEPAVAEEQPAVDDIDDSFNFDDFELPEFGEEEALTELEQAQESNQGQEPELDQEPKLEPESVEQELASEPVIETEQSVVDDIDDSFNFDDFELPEFGEEEALADFAAEPETGRDLPEPVTSDADEIFNFDDLELPQFGEEEALADFLSEPSQELALEQNAAPEVEQKPTRVEMDDVETLEDEQQQLADLFAQDAITSSIDGAYDKDAFDELLSDDENEHRPFFGSLDATSSDSAGMDIDAMLEMGGEDWNGFSLSPEQQASISDDIPEDEQQVWNSNNRPSQASVSDEDWGQQEDLGDFNPQANHFRTIDELMAEVGLSDDDFNPDSEALKLDVGLNEFPDVIGDIQDTDVDANAEAAGKLDLAKIYVEMNDARGAVKLLEEAIVDGSDEIRREAKTLIDAINGR